MHHPSVRRRVTAALQQYLNWDFQLNLELEAILTMFETSMTAVVITGLMIPEVAALALLQCVVLRASLRVMTERWGVPLQDGKDVFYLAHMRGMSRYMSIPLVLAVGLNVYFWLDNALNGWQALAYGVPSAVVIALLQHMIRLWISKRSNQAHAAHSE